MGGSSEKNSAISRAMTSETSGKGSASSMGPMLEPRSAPAWARSGFVSVLRLVLSRSANPLGLALAIFDEEGGLTVQDLP